MSNSFTFLVASLAFALILDLGQTAATECNVPKGIVLIVIDDIGYGDIDALFPSDLETPTLDKLSRQSIRLIDFHAGTTCSPTRGSLMTGRNVNAGGVWHTIAGRELLRADEQTMADVFQANGWKTGVFGKWHLGEGYPFSPRFRGFDVAVIHGGGGIGQGPDFWKNDYYSGIDFEGNPNRADVYFRNGHPVTADKFCTDFWFDNATDFIEDCLNDNKPFFCYLPTNAAHSPFNAPQGFKKGFDGLIENIDFNVSKMETFLDRKGVTDDILLIFTTDNGTAGKRFAGLRGKKGSHYDGGHNVPCFWRWKNGGLGGSDNSSRSIESLTAVMDLLPTFIDMFNLQRPAGGKPLHGISLKEMLLRSEFTTPDRAVIVDTQRTKDLVKWRRACVMQDEVRDGKIRHKWRLVKQSADSKPELYDFLVDRDTDNDIASSHAEKINELTREYESWWSRVSTGAAEYPAFVIDSEMESELTLQSHSWIGRDSSPWHQNSVRKAAKGSGVHSVEFKTPGRYRFELRRWPRENGGAITTKSKGGVGQAIPAKTAVLKIAGVGEAEKEIEPNQASIVFEMDVNKKIRTTIETQFLDSNQEKISGAYYVYVRKSD